MKHLPHVSVIVIFHNEHLSLLLRTVHGIFNRSPSELLEEIIMVNDASTKDELNESLQKYDLKERKGLIVARMEGAKVATSEVLVLDSHMEVNANWLPPLLGEMMDLFIKHYFTLYFITFRTNCFKSQSQYNTID